MSNRASMGHIYDQLKQEGHIDSDLPPYNPKTTDTPWFIQGLLGGGGWIAAFFLLGTIGLCITTMFSAMEQTSIGILLMVIGAVFAGGTVLLTKMNKPDGFFLSQLLLTFHLAGQLAFIGGMVTAFEMWYTDTQIVTVLVIVIIMQVIFIWLYPNVIYRFLGMLFIAMCLAGIEAILETPLLVSLAIGSLLFLSALVWLDRLPVVWQIHQMRLLHPVAYGAVIGALGLLIYEVTNRYYRDFEPTIMITGGILAVGLLWLIVTLLRDYDVSLSSRFAIALLAFAFVLSGIVIGTPGIMAGLIVVLMAFRRRNLILQGIGYAFFAGFVVYYYYWLDVTLLTKSIILLATGVLMLVARFGLNRIVIVPDAKKGESA